MEVCSFYLPPPLAGPSPSVSPAAVARRPRERLVSACVPALLGCRAVLWDTVTTLRCVSGKERVEELATLRLASQCNQFIYCGRVCKGACRDAGEQAAPPPPAFVYTGPAGHCSAL